MDRRHHRDARGVTLALSLALFAASPACAQDDAPDGSTILFREGVEHLRAGRFEHAVEAFRGSYRLAPRVTTMCNLALSYDRWGPEHREAAVRAYRTCAAEDESGRYRAHALERITALERELALEGDAPPPSEEPPEEPLPADAGSAASADAPAEDALDHAPAAARDRTLLWISIATGGGAAIALVTGVALALDAQSRAAALAADVPDGRIVRGSDEARRLDAARATADGATAAYVIAALLGAAAAALLTVDLVLAPGDRASAATLRLTPTGIAGTF